MTKIAQLQLFEELPPSAYDLERELLKTQEQVNNLRRGLFRRYDELCKDIADLKKNLKEDKGKNGNDNNAL